MDEPAKRSRRIPLVGGIGIFAGLAALGGGIAASGGTRSCEEAKIVSTIAECQSFVGTADAGRCIDAFAAASARKNALLDATDAGIYALKTARGSVTTHGVVRRNAQWQKIDGSVADRVYRQCSRASRSGYSRSYSSGYYSGGSSSRGGGWSSTSSGPTSIARSGFGSTGRSFSSSS